MKVMDSPFTFNRTIELNSYELSKIESEMPTYMAKMVANKFVEENWDKIKNDKALMKRVKDLVVADASARIVALIEKQVSDSLSLARKDQG